MTPREVIIRNAFAYVLANAVTFAFLLLSVHANDSNATRLSAFALAFIGPCFMVCTALEARRAWLHQPHDPVRDMSLPFLVVSAPFVLLYLSL